ncbi:hypothetical protein CPB84DRAFT_1826713 [Gymnopilus junonius]|uniref:MI domain-containing protein n=1 Tax=Gymnopilus junonius TaxID=109634 RepID=A0A9P5NHQ1_GYMJU|nr:hypothetical protein CPB84DRAFT_1826713 [Gymnopilus junonius]
MDNRTLPRINRLEVTSPGTDSNSCEPNAREDQPEGYDRVSLRGDKQDQKRITADNAKTSYDSAAKSTEFDIEFKQRMVDRNVKYILNGLMDDPNKFDTVADKLTTMANKAVRDGDGETLRHITGLVLNLATDSGHSDVIWDCACLIKHITENIRPRVQVGDSDEQPLNGSQFIREFLVNQVELTLDRYWPVGGVVACSLSHNGPMDGNSVSLPLQLRLALIKVITAVFIQVLLTEDITHKILENFFGNDDNAPEEIQAFLTFLNYVYTSGRAHRARFHMDTYLSRIMELQNNSNISTRTHNILQSLMDLHEQQDGHSDFKVFSRPETSHEAKELSLCTTEFFEIRDIKASKAYFTYLPSQLHPSFINSLVSMAITKASNAAQAKANAKLVSDFFCIVASDAVISPKVFEDGLMSMAYTIDDLIVDMPVALELFALTIDAAGLDEGRKKRVIKRSKALRRLKC